MTISKWGREFISAQEVSDYTGLDLTTVYQMARSGEILGAVWNETTLLFELEEFEEWFEQSLYYAVKVDGLLRELQGLLRTLEEKGFCTSYVDSDGEQLWYVPTPKPTPRTLH